MFHLIHDFCPEIFNAKVVHKFKRTVQKTVTYESTIESITVDLKRSLPAVTVWFDNECKTYVFRCIDGEYEEFVNELSMLCEEIQ